MGEKNDKQSGGNLSCASLPASSGFVWVGGGTTSTHASTTSILIFHMADTADLYKFLDHACRVCGGRLLQSSDGGKFVCAECGANAASRKMLCYCGVKVGKHQDAGLRCRRNVNQTPESPTQVIVEYVESKPKNFTVRHSSMSKRLSDSGGEFIPELDDDGLFC